MQFTRPNFTFIIAAILVAAMGLVGCGPGPGTVYVQPTPMSYNNPAPIDPCQPTFFQEYACQAALNSGGYYHYGTFYPYAAGYNRTIVIYRNNYNGWVSRGNRPTVVDYTAPEYQRSYVPSRTPAATTNSDTRSGSYRSPASTTTSSPVVSTSPQPRDPATGRFVSRTPPPPLSLIHI